MPQNESAGAAVNAGGRPDRDRKAAVADSEKPDLRAESEISDEGARLESDLDWDEPNRDPDPDDDEAGSVSGPIAHRPPADS